MNQAMQAGSTRKGALHSGLDVPECLRDFWYPVEFSSKLRQGKPKAFSLFKEHWQLIRDADGIASCRLDLSEQGYAALSLLLLEMPLGRLLSKKSI